MDQNDDKEYCDEKYEVLLKEQEELDKAIAEIRARGVTADLRPEIEALHEYNDMKDLAHMILEYLANAEQVSVLDLHVRYGLPTD